MAVELTLGGSDRATVEWIRSKSDKIVAALTNKLNFLMLRLQQKIGEKLHGQVLNQRTGKGAGSIRAIPVEQQGSELVGAVEGGGGPAYYMRFQNDGTGPYTITPVNKKVLAFMLNGKQVFAKRVHHPGLKAKNFMGGTLDEMTPEIVSGMQATLDEAVGS